MEILVCSSDRPVEESAGRWERGDVVCVMPDGHEWARRELDESKFHIIKLPGVGRNQLEDLVEDDTEFDPVTGKDELEARRKIRLSEQLLEMARLKQRIRLVDVKNGKWQRPRPTRRDPLRGLFR